MLLSMTGQGECTIDRNGVHVCAELRSVNNRFLKVSTRISDVVARFDNQIEPILRKHLKRGSIQVALRVRMPAKADAFRICPEALQSYLEQVYDFQQKQGFQSQLNLGDFLPLPGVVASEDSFADIDEHLQKHLEEALAGAAQQLNKMRAAEGDSMALQLLKSIDQLEVQTLRIRERAPSVIEDYRQRLETKIRKVLAENQLEVSSIDLLKEVQVFADRSDINEELVRLASHFEQFRKTIHDPESQGRKLDFLIQELFRETNTIGSKGNDATISQAVVEMKTVIEQMRELIQNVE